MSRPDDDARTRVAAQLERMAVPGGEMAVDGPRASVELAHNYHRGRPTAQRDEFRSLLIARYLDRQQSVRREAKAALLTAGPPGAGKSTALTRLRLADEGWRLLDADIIKAYLAEEAAGSGRYDDLLAHLLADGHPIMPAELAPLTHIESLSLLADIRRECLQRGENVVIEGTLAWPDAAGQLLNELVQREYQDVTIIDVEVPLAVAHEQSLRRWWDARKERITTGQGLGGRFTPASAITRAFSDPADPHSVCAANARSAFASAAALALPVITLTVYDSTGPAPVTETHQRRSGELQTKPIASPLPFDTDTMPDAEPPSPTL